MSELQKHSLAHWRSTTKNEQKERCSESKSQDTGKNNVNLCLKHPRAARSKKWVGLVIVYVAWIFICTYYMHKQHGSGGRTEGALQLLNSRREPGTRMSVLLANPDYLLEGFAEKTCQVNSNPHHLICTICIITLITVHWSN